MGDQLVMHDDGTVTIGWGDFSTTLREPDIGEWLSFEQEFARANAWARGEEAEGENPPTVLDAATDGPYLALYTRLVTELGVGLTGDVPTLPPWLTVGAVYGRISQWWSTSPLSRQEAAALIRMQSQ